MADIDVVKKSSNTWLWILLLVIAIAGIVWFMSSRAHTATQTGRLLEPAPAAMTADSV